MVKEALTQRAHTGGIIVHSNKSFALRAIASDYDDLSGLGCDFVYKYDAIDMPVI